MRLAHTALFAADLERARTFYTRYFDCTAGARYHNPRTGFRSYFLTFPEGGQLELMAWDEVTPRPEGRFRGLDHIAIHVGSRPAVDALTARLAQDGYSVVSPPRVTGDGYYESCVLWIARAPAWRSQDKSA